MTFKDIFKSDFLENVASFSPADTLIALFLAFAVGLFIFWIYKKTYKGVMYSASFAMTLIAMTLITTFVILAVTSNVVLSLGMVGALSIVRFRTAIKEPMDIAFLFWAIAAGIVIGAGMLVLAVLGSVLIGVVMLAFSNKKVNDRPYLLVVDFEDGHFENDILRIVKETSPKYVVKSKTVSPKGIECSIEVRVSNMETQFVNKVASVESVGNAVLVSYNGEYLG